jgi:hypothetical protein
MGRHNNGLLQGDSLLVVAASSRSHIESIQHGILRRVVFALVQIVINVRFDFRCSSLVLSPDVLRCNSLALSQWTHISIRPYICLAPCCVVTPRSMKQGDSWRGCLNQSKICTSGSKPEVGIIKLRLFLLQNIRAAFSQPLVSEQSSLPHVQLPTNQLHFGAAVIPGGDYNVKSTQPQSWFLQFQTGYVYQEGEDYCLVSQALETAREGSELEGKVASSYTHAYLVQSKRSLPS